MAFSFPTSPTLNQEYAFGNKIWRYNGTGWVLITGVDAAQSAWSTANLAYIQSNVATTIAQGAYNNSNTKFNISGGTIGGNVTITNDLSVLGNVNFVGNVTSLQVTGNSGQFFGYTANGFTALYAGIPVGYDFQPQTVFQVTGSDNGYSQINNQNINPGDQASGDYVVTADNGNENDTYVDLGIGSSTHNDLEFTLVGPNDAYLYAHGNTVTGGGDLVLGTFLDNDVVFAAGGMNDENEQMRIVGSSNTIIIRSNLNTSNAKSIILGPVGNVHITGGSNDDFIRTDGLGNLTFVSLTSANVIKELYYATNSSFIQANASFNSANNIDGVNLTQNTNILSAASYANSAFGAANSAGVYANGAFIQANAAFTTTNTNLFSAETKLIVTAPGLYYNFDQYSGTNPTLYVSPGRTIAFHLSSGVTSHPFVIRETASGTNVSSGLTHVSPTGVISIDAAAQGQVSGNLYWKVPENLRNKVYVYQCTIHSGMVGNIQIEPHVNDVYIQANSAFIHANAAFNSANNIDGVNLTQNNSITAAFAAANVADAKAVVSGNYANAAFTRANNSLDANNGGSVSGTILSTANVRADYIVANTGFASGAGLSKLSLSDIGIVAIDVASQQFKFGAAGIESNPGIYGGAFGGNKLSLNNETNLRSERYDVVKIQTGTDGTTVNEWVFSNNSLTAPGGITANGFTAGGINVVPTLTSSFNTANSAFIHANAAFLAANNATDTYVRNHANSAFIHANSAYESQNATGQYANSAFIHANSSYIHVNAAFAFANTISGGSAIDNVARDSANSAGIYANGAFVRANNSLNANTGGQITGDITITGNLIVVGETVYANARTVLIADNIITLNAAIDQTSAPTMNAGIEVDRGNQPNVTLLWNETTDKLTFTNDGTTYSDLGSGSGSAGDYANGAFIQANAAFAVANAANAAAANGGSVVVTFATAPPVSGNANGHIWIDSTDGTEYMYFKDSDGSQWVEFGPSSSNVTTNTFITANIASTYTHANAAYTHANAASQHANASFEVANVAASLANSAYAAANNVTSDRLSSNLKLNIIQVLESANIYTTAIGGNVNIDIGNNTSYFFSSNTTANVTFNIRGNTTTTFDTTVAIGQTASVAIALKQGATKYKANVYIDGVLQTPYWLGNSSPGYATTQPQSIDVYTYTIFKTAASTYSILAANSNFGLAQGQPGQG